MGLHLRSLLPFSSLFIPLLMLAPLLIPSYQQNLSETICKATARNYTDNSAYQSNLQRLLTSLAAGVSASGYLAKSTGDIPDKVYGDVVCSEDVNVDSCRDCLKAARLGVVKLCPYKKQALVYYDHCFLRYADNWSFPFTTEGRNDVYTRYNNSPVAVTVLPPLKEQLVKMMQSLASDAANNSPGRMFATGKEAFTSSDLKIYGLVECTTDQPATVCHDCLTTVLRQITQGSVAWGARILGQTCFFRYELYPFYNGSAAAPALPPSPIWSVPQSSPKSPAPALLPSSTSSPTSSKENRRRTTKWRSVAIPVGVVLSLITVTGISIYKMKARKKTQCMRKIPCVRSLLCDLSTLRAATDNFSSSNKLGEGGFGAVYKGILADGQIVAVKKLSASSRQGSEELRNEASLLAKQEHRNVVRLLGVCLDQEEKLLVYEYMPNRSLDNFLFDPTKSKQLIWQLRYKIVEGVARGLHYLHEEYQYTIIHRDLKASNILLDADMDPKISDFGISRLFFGDQTHESTSHVAGTFGYMAPEYVINGQFSNKSDVFSFGVLVLQVVTGRTNSSFSCFEGSINLLSYVWQHWTTGNIQELIDPSLGDLYQQTEVFKCIHIGLLCVQESPADRPAMSTVVLMLDGLSMTVDVPLQPAFWPGQSETDHLPKSMHSSNKLSITSLDPR